MKLKKAIIISVLAAGVLSMAACGKADKKTESGNNTGAASGDAQELLNKIEEANTRDSINAGYAAYKEIYSSSDGGEKSYTYISHDIWYNYYGENPNDNFAYMDADRAVGLSAETGTAYYSCIINQDSYDETFEIYMSPYMYDFTDYDKEIIGDGRIKLTSEWDAFDITVDPKSLLKTKEVYTLSDAEDYEVVSEYEYIKDSEDAKIKADVDEFIKKQSGGKTVKLTIIGADGTETVFDIPYGFEAAIYGNAEAYKYVDNDEYYYYEPITEDTTLVEAEGELEDEEYEELELGEDGDFVLDFDDMDISNIDVNNLEYVME